MHSFSHDDTKTMAPRLVDDETELWKKSVAKKLLVEDILSGAIPNTMHWETVRSMRPEYGASTRRLFGSRLKSLRDQIDHSIRNATVDAAALAHDRAICPAPTHNYRGEPRWEGSEAERLLKEDFANAIQKTMKPSDFHKTRAEYQQYPLAVFRGHIYQEQRFNKFCTWRNEDPKQKKATDW
jgi:hypothetical protein